MEGSSTPKNDQTKETQDNEDDLEIIIEDDEFTKLMQTLPIENDDKEGIWKLVKYQGFWFGDFSFKHVLAFQRHFRARDSDIIIASFPKTGNTWLKSILFGIVNRGSEKYNNLFQKHPHELVCHLENDVYGKVFEYPQPRHLDHMSSPRLFSTHMPYHSLPESVKTSECRVLYLTRNPLDAFVSNYYFVASAKKKMLGNDGGRLEMPSMEDYIERRYCQGKTAFGPFLDHVKEYWVKSSELPDKMMFLMYEDLKHDLTTQVKRIAEFVGFPFSEEEESQGVVERIMDVCDFNNLKEQGGNKSGVINKFFDKKSYFRKGEVGDWINHLSPTIGDRLMKFTQDEVCGSGLSFKFHPC